MISDLHSHILPAVDDGSANVEESTALLRLLKAQGIHRVVATPHFYPGQDHPDRFLERRHQALEQLRLHLGKERDLPEIVLGAEVLYYPGMSDSDALRKLTIGDSSYLLVEMPMGPWTETMFRELKQIWEKQGLVPVVAHVDRYIGPFRTHGIPEKLEELPVLVQANASFFLGRSTRSMALRMLKKGQIHLLGSDCHNLKHRPPRLGEAVAVIRDRLGREVLDQVEETEALIFG